MIQIFLAAPLPVQVHGVGALLAIALLPLTLWRRRRDRVHKAAGYVWVLAMLAVALSSFFITGGLAVIGPFGPIHLISVYVLWGLGHGLRAIRRGDLCAHQQAMRGIAAGGLGVAGVLTFLPGRRMNVALFGEASLSGFLLIAGLAICVALLPRLWQSRAA